MNKLVRIGCLLSVVVVNALHGYVFYNQSEDPTDIITVVGFKNEKHAMMFMEQMGWTGEVEKVSDYVAAGLKFVPVVMMPPFCLVTPLMFVTPRIAEVAIRTRFVICEHRNLLPKKVWQAANEKIQKKERHSAAWNWYSIKQDKGVADLFFLVFRKYVRDINLQNLSADTLLGATKPGEKYRTEIVAAGYGNRSAAIVYKGAGQAFEQRYPFVPAIFKPLVPTQKIPSKRVQFELFAEGTKKGMLLYEYRVGATMEQVKAREEENQPIKVAAEKADQIVKQEFSEAKKELEKTNK